MISEDSQSSCNHVANVITVSADEELCSTASEDQQGYVPSSGSTQDRRRHHTSVGACERASKTDMNNHIRPNETRAVALGEVAKGHHLSVRSQDTTHQIIEQQEPVEQSIATTGFLVSPREVDERAHRLQCG